MRIVFDGQQCLDEYIQLLESAEKSIWICMYMIRFDHASKRIWEVLRRKHAAGVEVQVHYDLFGSFRSLAALIPTAWCSAYVPRWYRLGVRNHAKVIIVDDKTAVVSGRNFTKRYYEEWVDASVFIEDEKRLGRILAFKERVERPGSDPDDTDSVLQITDTLTGTRSVYNFVLEHIVKSKERIEILSPYFVIDEALEGLLLAAAERGVRITIIVPKQPEHRMAKTFNRINFQRIHHENVEIKRSTGMFHSKIMLFDDVALVGSANFDNRSFKHNLEASVVADKELLKKIEKHLAEVADHSVHYNWIQRAYDNVLFHFTRHFMDLL